VRCSATLASKKGLHSTKVADETNISKRFLQGIENDNFQGFPGSLYHWFYENYAEFLGLDIEAMLARYNSQEINLEEGLIASNIQAKAQEKL